MAYLGIQVTLAQECRAIQDIAVLGYRAILVTQEVMAQTAQADFQGILVL